MHQRLTGAHTLIVTPFDDEGDLDEVSLAQLTDHVIAGGVDGVIGLGTTGEFFTMSPEERLRGMEVILSAARGRVPVTIGVSDSSTRVSIALAARAEELGAACVMLAPPYYFGHSSSAVHAHFEAVSAAVQVPLMIYDGGGGVELAVDEVVRLSARAPRIRYIKLSLPKPAKVAAVRQATPHVDPLCGDDTMLMLALRYGAVGSTIGIGNLRPRAVAALHRAAEAGDWDRARAIHSREILPAVAVCGSAKSEYIRCFKEVLHAWGVIRSAHTRLPLQALDPVRRDELFTVVNEVVTA
jgi:4-hydroxy-tetrahydrodipicolinate synthase